MKTPPAHPLPDKAALIVIDVQNGFDAPQWGRRNNPQAEDNIAKLLAAWRRTKRPVIHVQHMSRNPKSPLAPGQEGNGIKAAVRPLPGEPVVQKCVNSSFIGTDLEARLRGNGIKTVILTGINTNYCVSTTARMAGNLGFEAYVISDATATFDMTGPDGTLHPAETMHAVGLTELHGEFATVVDTQTVLRLAEETGAMKKTLLAVLVATTALAGSAGRAAEPMAEGSFLRSLAAGRAEAVALKESGHAEKLRRLFDRLNSLAPLVQRNAIGYASETSFYAEAGEAAAKAAKRGRCLDEASVETLSKVQDLVQGLSGDTDRLLIETEGIEHEAIPAASLGFAAAGLGREAADLDQLAAMFSDTVDEHEDSLEKACQADAAMEVRENAARAKWQAKTLRKLAENIIAKVHREVP